MNTKSVKALPMPAAIEGELLDNWCPDCINCHEIGWAHLSGHRLNCQCEDCFAAWAPQKPPKGRMP